MELKDKVRLNKVTHSVRASQAVIQYGVGAMVDFPEQTLMTAAPEMWDESVIEIHDERLEKVLHVDYFGMPGSKDEGRYQNGVSYARFPEWYFCPRCRRFQPLKEWIKEYKSTAKNKQRLENDPYMVKRLKCSTCFQDLVVARIVTACSNGHIDDFPWVKWVHAKNMLGSRKVCDNPKLKFTTSASSSAGLEGLSITCVNCNAKATLKDAFDKDALRKLDEKTGYSFDFHCCGRHPWKNEKETCGEYPHVLQRGGSSVYFPISVSSLVIPPYSSKLTAMVQNSSKYSDFRKSISESIKTLSGLGIPVTQEMKDNVIQQKISEYSEKIATEIGRKEQQVKTILERRWAGNDESYSTGSVRYRAEEYSALSGEITLEDPNGEFVREGTDISLYGIPFVKNVSLIHKIREVQALTGFSRLEPVDADNISEGGKIKAVSIKKNDTNWYPGYEVRGEGIFIEFDSDAIDLWRSSNEEIKRRVDLLNENYAKSYYGGQRPRTISAKFLLLHTISHLLMKQLSFECGYNIASIKERLYCSEASEGKCMSGILIYTASGDSEGTMGGLVRQGRADMFPTIFRKAIESAINCSNDPVCSLSMGQGRDSLNLSACHSCCLVPETSCEEFNVFLDRGVVIGTFENSSIGFLSNYAFGNEVYKAPKKVKSEESKKKQVMITDVGLDLSGAKYSEVWEALKQFSDNIHERELLEALIEKADMFETKEKPRRDGTFQVLGNGEYYGVDLIWPESKVMIFSEAYAEEYEVARDGEWKCFLLSDAKTDVMSIANVIKEK